MLDSPDPSRLRILEIGLTSLFRTAYPDRTTLIWTGLRTSSDLEIDGTATPETMIRMLRDVREGRYDVIAAYPTLYHPAHPRYGLRSAFRRPFHPWSGLTRSFGTSYLRFLDGRVPLIVADFDDAGTIGSPMAHLLDKATVGFKRELPTDKWRAVCGVAHPHLPTQRIRRNATWNRRIDKLRPINLPLYYWQDSYAGDAFPEKTADLFFAGSIAGNSTVRADGMAELDRLRERGVRIDIPERPLSRAEFCARMSHSWLAWSPEGLGWHCIRHPEAALCQSVPVMNYPTVLRATPLEDGVHGFYYPPEPGGLTRTVMQALADKERLRQMAQAGRAFCADNFTVKACCDYMLRVLYDETQRAARSAPAQKTA